MPRSCSGNVGAELLVEVREDLRVAAARETGGRRARAPRRSVDVVVELAVLDRPDRSVLVRERLVAALDVDDAEAPRAERDPRRRKMPRSSGPRCTIASVIRSSRPAARTSLGEPEIWTAPQMPHIQQPLSLPVTRTTLAPAARQRRPRASSARRRSDRRRCFSRRWFTAARSSRSGRRRTAASR